MRIGVVSDIHCNVEALDAALAAMAGRIDALWCPGDVVVQSRFCARTTRTLREAGAILVQGNHDELLLGTAGERARARVADEEGVATELAWLAAQPLRREETLGGRRVLMVHGSPWEPRYDYLGSCDLRWRNADQLGVDIVLTGHTHVPMAMFFGSTLVVNPGSVAEPQMPDDRPGTYAIVDTGTMQAQIHRVELD